MLWTLVSSVTSDCSSLFSTTSSSKRSASLPLSSLSTPLVMSPADVVGSCMHGGGGGGDGGGGGGGDVGGGAVHNCIGVLSDSVVYT